MENQREAKEAGYHSFGPGYRLIHVYPGNPFSYDETSNEQIKYSVKTWNHSVYLIVGEMTFMKEKEGRFDPRPRGVVQAPSPKA